MKDERIGKRPNSRGRASKMQRVWKHDSNTNENLITYLQLYSKQCYARMIIVAYTLLRRRDFNPAVLASNSLVTCTNQRPRQIWSGKNGDIIFERLN